MRILGLGHCPIDETYHTDRPIADVAGVADLGPPLVRAGGGGIANTLCLLARLGHECHFVGNCGDDAGADFLVGEFRAHGVVPHLVRKPGRRTPRAILLCRGDGTHRFVPDWHNAPRDVSPDDVRAAGLDHLRYDLFVTEIVFPPAPQLADLADRTAFNGQSPRMSDRRRGAIRAIAGRAFLFVACEAFVRQFHAKAAGELGAAELDFGAPPPQPSPTRGEGAVRMVVATVGAAGLVGLYRAGGETEFFAQSPPAPVAAVDSSGAGDACLGALLHRLGLSQPTLDEFRHACAAAQRVAGLCCTRWGARGHLADMDAVRAALEP